MRCTEGNKLVIGSVISVNEDDFLPTDKKLQLNNEKSIYAGESKIVNKLLIGDNLDGLKLLMDDYKGKIDVIYIDPPYGSSIRGNHAKTNYENNITRDNLLSMLYPRLDLAKDLLSNEGVIFISIDDNEQAQLKLLCDSIFGEQNFLNNIIWTYGKMSNESRKFANNHEYILVYSKSESSVLKPTMKKEDTEYRNRWLKYIKDNKIYYGDVKDKKDKMITARVLKYKKEHGYISDTSILYDFDKEYKVDSDVIYSPIIKGNAGEKVKDFGLGQKPLDLICRLLSAIPNKNATVLDFFAGSGTTGQAVMELNAEDKGNRTFLLCTNNEITDKTPSGIAYDVTTKRLKRVMTGCCYDGSNDFKWLEKNKPYGGNLEIYDIIER